MIEAMNFGATHQSRPRGVFIGVFLLLLISLAIYPFRRSDYELQFLLVLPVVYRGCARRQGRRPDHGVARGR